MLDKLLTSLGGFESILKSFQDGTLDESTNVSSMRCSYRLAIAIPIGIASTLLSYHLLLARGTLASDFTWPWRAARALIVGENPYLVIQNTGPYPFSMAFYYPLPAALVALPFVYVEPYWAGALFFGLSSFLLAYSLTAKSLWRLSLFLSPSFFVAAYVAQWSPLMLAVALIPRLQMLLLCKPNLGIVSFIYNPTKTGVVAIIVGLALSLFVMPLWPIWWLALVAFDTVRKSPIAVFPGILLILSFLRWRTREGRAFIALAVLPQHIFFYDELALWLIPKSLIQSIALSLIAWVGYLGWYFSIQSAITGPITSMPWIAQLAAPLLAPEVEQAPPWVIVFFFLPALIILLLPAKAASHDAC